MKNAQMIKSIHAIIGLAILISVAAVTSHYLSLLLSTIITVAAIVIIFAFSQWIDNKYYRPKNAKPKSVIVVVLYGVVGYFIIWGTVELLFWIIS